MATLLLIEDDHVMRGILSDALSSTYDCHTADRAEQALEFLEIETYDVVLTDLAMPGLGGRELLRRVKESHPDLPVIIVSATGLDDQEALMEMGAFAYIQKPFRLEEVERAIERALAQNKESKQQPAFN